MENWFKEGDYLVFVGSGSGAAEVDHGKVVRFLENRPSGAIANDYDNYDVYYEILPGETYETTNNYNGSQDRYGRAGAHMFRLALQTDLERYGSPTNESLVLEWMELKMKREIGL